ncbi:uncharacterized protein LOC119189818 [Manduca sexta]|uniref:uncharacterized protein LOC119189818 n=1 Tax=Manduca sexta TaxID=7130 RepID=UPI00188F36A8|nr:uncharacterized protein LOC119189818 [Manduca sexta]
MRDVQAEADARHRLDAAARAKDDELARQAALLRDMDAERGRLRDKIDAMQATIDNIQKELTGPAPAPCAERRQRPERLRAEPAPPLDRMLYNFLSDASADADGHDSPLSLSQVKIDLNAKSRAFFKNKRCDAKHKRAK